MVNNERTRMYCHPEFKKMLELRRIEYGERDTIRFTKRLASNPSLLKSELFNKEKQQNGKKKSTGYPSLF